MKSYPDEKKRPLFSHLYYSLHHYSLHRSLLITCILTLSACVSQPTYIDSQQIPTAIPDTWFMHAKLGIRHLDDSGSVTIHWEQQQEHYRIRITGPLGQGNALLTGNQDTIIIERPGQATIASDNPEALIEDVFGWRLPINEWRYWITGQAAPAQTLNDNTATPQEQFSETGLLKERKQNGWVLRYSRYKPVASLNQKILAHRVKAQQATTQLTLVIRDWHFGATL